MNRVAVHAGTQEALAPLLLDAILAPRRAVRAAARRRRALDLFAALAVCFSSTATIATSIAAAAIRAVLDCGAAPEVRERAEEGIRRQRVASTAGEPVFLALRAGGSAAALILGGAAFGRAPPWAQAWRVALVTEIPQGIGRVVDLEALFRYGPEMSLEMDPLFRPSISLAELAALRNASPARSACAERATPFLLWSMVLVGMGARECGGSRRSALATAVTASLLALGLAAGGAALDERMKLGARSSPEGAPVTNPE